MVQVKGNVRPVNARLIAKLRLGVIGRRVIAYVGGFGGWYLTDEIVHFYEVAKKHDPSVFALVLTKHDVKGSLLAKGFTDEDLFVQSVKPEEVPELLRAADVAISFIKPCFSKLASSPTKIAEYLACGVPVISNKDIGDCEFLVEDRVGVLLDDFSEASYIKALQEITRL